MSATGARLVFDAARKGPRHCGDCQLCCKLLPVRSLGKGANERCKHQRTGKGCLIYRKPGFPSECHAWSCRWLLHEPGTEAMRRPDRAHYCLDMMPDYVTIVNNETGERTDFEVVQVWCDPGHPDAHRDPALRAFLETKRLPAIVRYSARGALTLWPPCQSQDRQWREVKGDELAPTHTPAQLAAALGLRVTVQP